MPHREAPAAISITPASGAPHIPDRDLSVLPIASTAVMIRGDAPTLPSPCWPAASAAPVSCRAWSRWCLRRDVVVVGNVGDDVEPHGLHVSPDLDTVLYTLTGWIDEDKGWGVRGDSDRALERARSLGADAWFWLGDLDIGLHLARTEALRRGEPLSAVTARLAQAARAGADAAAGHRRPAAHDHRHGRRRDRLPDLLRAPRARRRGHARSASTVPRRRAPAPGVTRGAARRARDRDRAVEPADLDRADPGGAGRSRAAGGTHRRPALRSARSWPAGRCAARRRRCWSRSGTRPRRSASRAIYQGLIDVLVLDEQDAELAARVEQLGMRAVVVDTIMRDAAARERLARAALRRGRDRRVRLEILPLRCARRDRGGRGSGRAAAGRRRRRWSEGDVVVVSHKAVSKSEGRVADLREVTPSARAIELAGPDGDPRQVEMVLRESRRIVRRRGSLLIAETHHGFVCASAGIDRSNAPGADMVVLLPVDPDASAAGAAGGAGAAERRAAGGGGGRHDGPAAAKRDRGHGHRRQRPGAAARVPRPGGSRPATRCERRRWRWPTSWRRPPTWCWASWNGCRPHWCGATRPAARARARELIRESERDLFI